MLFAAGVSGNMGATDSLDRSRYLHRGPRRSTRVRSTCVIRVGAHFPASALGVLIQRGNTRGPDGGRRERQLVSGTEIQAGINGSGIRLEGEIVCAQIGEERVALHRMRARAVGRVESNVGGEIIALAVFYEFG